MPRKASDKTVTHRIELGLVERDKINQIIKTQKENQRLDAITATLQAAGMAIGGIGALGAGLALAAWLAPGLIDSAKDKTKEAVDNLTQKGIEILNEITPANAKIPEVDKLRDELTELQQKERESNGRKVYYCTPSSKGFDEQQCQIATAENENDKQEIRDFYDRMQGIITAVKEGKLTEGAGLINPIFNFAPGGKWAFWED